MWLITLKSFKSTVFWILSGIAQNEEETSHAKCIPCFAKCTKVNNMVLDCPLDAACVPCYRGEFCHVRPLGLTGKKSGGNISNQPAPVFFNRHDHQFWINRAHVFLWIKVPTVLFVLSKQIKKQERECSYYRFFNKNDLFPQIFLNFFCYFEKWPFLIFCLPL